MHSAQYASFLFTFKNKRQYIDKFHFIYSSFINTKKWSVITKIVNIRRTERKKGKKNVNKKKKKLQKCLCSKEAHFWPVDQYLANKSVDANKTQIITKTCSWQVILTLCYVLSYIIH